MTEQPYPYKGDIIDWESHPLTMAEYRNIQTRLKATGGAIGAVEQRTSPCRNCGSAGGVADVYWNDIHERVFSVCMDCWSIHEETPVYASMLEIVP